MSAPVGANSPIESSRSGAGRSGTSAGARKAVHNEKLLDMEAGSSIGIRASNSRFVVIHDDDDSWQPTFLAGTTLADNNSSADTSAVAVRFLVDARCRYVFEPRQGLSTARNRGASSFLRTDP